MKFQDTHHLTVDAFAGPAVWRALVADTIAGKRRTDGYSYVYVHRDTPQLLTLWHDGHTVLTSPGNTGVPAAPTELGTFPVFEHLASATMSGTNPDGSHYNDPGIKWVSYFNGGDALHAFNRALLRHAAEPRLRRAPARRRPRRSGPTRRSARWSRSSTRPRRASERPAASEHTVCELLAPSPLAVRCAVLVAVAWLVVRELHVVLAPGSTSGSSSIAGSTSPCCSSQPRAACSRACGATPSGFPGCSSASAWPGEPPARRCT